MKGKHNLARILFISLCLQSCSTSFNPPIVPIKKKQLDHMQLSVKKLVNNNLTSKEGHIVTFYEEAGKLQAEVEENLPAGFTRKQILPVIIALNLSCSKVMVKELAWQKKFMHITKNSVYIGNMGLIGGGKGKKIKKEEASEAEAEEEEEKFPAAVTLPKETINSLWQVGQGLKKELYKTEMLKVLAVKALNKGGSATVLYLKKLGKLGDIPTIVECKQMILPAVWQGKSLDELQGILYGLYSQALRGMEEELTTLSELDQIAQQLYILELKYYFQRLLGPTSQEKEAIIKDIQRGMDKLNLLALPETVNFRRLYLNHLVQEAYKKLTEEEQETQAKSNQGTVSKLEQIIAEEKTKSSDIQGELTKQKGYNKQLQEEQAKHEQILNRERKENKNKISSLEKLLKSSEDDLAQKKEAYEKLKEEQDKQAKSNQVTVSSYVLDINATDKYGNCPLHVAAVFNHVKVARMLLEKGADVNVKDKDGDSSPLHFSAILGHMKIAKLLLKNGADVNAKDKAGSSPLHIGVMNGWFELAKLLLEHGADVNAKDKDGNSPLHFAATYGHVKIARLLLEHGADVNIKNEDGNSPLQVADKGHLEVVKLLLEHGADVDGKDR
jgi:ankyrin repeat protein